MAATVQTWVGVKRDGSPFTMSLYNAANGAVGTYLPIDASGNVATANSPTFITSPDQDVLILDTICAAATGTVTLEISSVPKFSVDYAAHQASNAGRPKYRQMVPARSTLAVRVVSVLPA